MKKPSRSRQRSGINVTPYIDILLVLLIIFMVIQPTARYDLKGRLPQEPPPGQPAVPQTPIVLTLDLDYSLHLNGQLIEFSSLGRSLWEVFSGRADKTLFVRADDEMAYGTVVHAIDIAKGAGVREVALLAKDQP